MQDNKLAEDEARRSAQHENVRAEIESDVNAEVAGRAAHYENVDLARLDNVAGTMHERAVNEVISTENEIHRARGLARVSQFIDYIFFIIYGLLIIRLLLTLMAARSSAGFVEFIRNITDPIYAPFKGIVPSPTVEGGYTLALPIVIALVVYILIHAAINGLLRIFAHRKTEI